MHVYDGFRWVFVSNLEWVEGGARENDCLWLWARLGEVLGRVYGTPSFVSLLASLLLPSLPFPCLPFLVPAAFPVSRKCPSITQEVPCSCVVRLTAEDTPEVGA